MNDLTDLAALPDWAADLVDAARSGGEDVAAAVAAARKYGALLPQPGHDTATRWAVLAAVAAADLTPARVLEAHSDALAILAEAGEPVPTETTWGVFAAEAPGARLDAEIHDSGSATLTGVKPWCSLAADLDAALVTAHTPDGRRLFRVDLHHPGVTVDPPQRWVARGLRTVVSTSVSFDAVPATPVGPAGWYLIRPGFAWGGMGVAACWYGAATALGAAVRTKASADSATDLVRMHLGAAEVALYGARCALSDAAAAIDAGRGGQRDGERLALLARSVVAEACEQVLRTAAHALGPAALVFDAEHAARVADLQVYVRQHHGERDLAALGAHIVADLS